MAEPAAAVGDRPLTLEEKKAAARARAKAARQAQEVGQAFVAISPAAADYIRACAAEQGRPDGVRLKILAGGCSGLEYKLDLLEVGEAAGEADRAIESNGVTMLDGPEVGDPRHRLGHRLRVGPPAARLPHQQPERHRHLLLRGLLQRVAPAAGPWRRCSAIHAAIAATSRSPRETATTSASASSTP